MARRAMRGFTLVELLVVIAIIGILATILVPTITRARSKAQRSACLSNLREIGKACQMYMDDFRFFPFDGDIEGGETEAQSEAACFQLLIQQNYIDDPAVFVCPASTDFGSEMTASAQASFTFGSERNWSYGYRKELTTANERSTSPISCDKRVGDNAQTNHLDGVQVLYFGNNVEWLPLSQDDQISDVEGQMINSIDGFSGGGA